MKKLAIAAMLVAAAGAAQGQESFATIAGPLNHAGASGDLDNSSFSLTAVGGYTLGDISWTGDFQEVIGATLPSEADFIITAPDLSTFTVEGTDGFVGLQTNSTNAFAGIDPAGLWTFELIDTFDDGAGADGFWDALTFDFGVFTPPPTLADFVLSTLVDGDMVMGDTSNSSDDLQGTFGDPVGGGNETGGDDVYSLDWAGGDLTLTLDILTDGQDLDLFIYDSADAAAPLDLAFTTANPEVIEIEGLAAGKYFVRVDGFLGDAGEYKLSVTPAPASAALMALGGLVAARRRRA